MSESQHHEIALLDRASQALAEAESFDQIKEVRDKAEAVRKYAQSASLGLDIQNRAAEVKLCAERQAGMLLTQMLLRGGDRRSKAHDERLKLNDLGITRNQSTRWQLEARIPEDVFREYIRETRESGKELTSARLIRLANGRKSSHNVDSHQHTVNGHGAKRPGKLNGRLRFRDERDSGDPLSQILSDLNNHHQLLDNILRPIYLGESTSLLPAERRVLRYLLIESQRLLGHLDQLPRSPVSCACHSDRASSKTA